MFDISVAWANYSGSDDFYVGGLNADKMYNSSVRHLPIYKFETLVELDLFKDTFDSVFSMDGTYDEVPSFETVTSEMNEEYFKGNTVFVVYVSANSGSYRFGVNSIYKDADNLCIHIEQSCNPEAVTMDMAGWFLIVSLDKNIVQGISNFDADLNNF